MSNTDPLVINSQLKIDHLTEADLFTTIPLEVRSNRWRKKSDLLIGKKIDHFLI